MCHLPCCSLGVLVNKNRPEQLHEVVCALCDRLLTSKTEQLRDLATQGLKTVVAGAHCRRLLAAWRQRGCVAGEVRWLLAWPIS